MRHLRPFFLFALAALLAASCDPHQFPTEGEGGDFPVRLRFHYDLPVHRTIEIQTKAKAEARPRARYTVQLYRYVGEYDYTVAPVFGLSFTSEEISDLDTTLCLPVAPERYKLLAWTDYVDEAGKPYWDASDFDGISLSSDYRGGAVARDAFRGGGTLDLSGLKAAGLTRELTVEMRRPVARVRFLIPDALTWLSAKGLAVSDLRASLSWSDALPDVYDVFGDRFSGRLGGAGFTVEPYLDDEGFLVLCMDHVLTGPDGLTAVAAFRLATAGGQDLGSWTGGVPLLRGNRTDILLRPSVTPPPGPDDTDTGGGIGIDPTFTSEIEITI